MVCTVLASVLQVCSRSLDQSRIGTRPGWFCTDTVGPNGRFCRDPHLVQEGSLQAEKTNVWRTGTVAGVVGWWIGNCTFKGLILYIKKAAQTDYGRVQVVLRIN